MIRLLVADNFPQMMDAIRRLCASYEDVELIAEASHFQELEEVLLRGAPDVVLMDDYLAPFDSAAATRKLREMGLSTPVLVMSMHSDADFIQASLEAGANGYIVKGEFVEELSPALLAVTQGRRYLSTRASAALAQGKQ